MFLTDTHFGETFSLPLFGFGVDVKYIDYKVKTWKIAEVSKATLLINTGMWTLPQNSADFLKLGRKTAEIGKYLVIQK